MATISTGSGQVRYVEVNGITYQGFYHVSGNDKVIYFFDDGNGNALTSWNTDDAYCTRYPMTIDDVSYYLAGCPVNNDCTAISGFYLTKTSYVGTSLKDQINKTLSATEESKLPHASYTVTLRRETTSISSMSGEGS